MEARFVIAVVLVLLCSSAWASFTYTGSYNGSNPADPSDAQVFKHPSGLLYLGGKLYVTDSGRGALYVMNGSYAFNSTSRLKLISSQSSDSALSDPARMMEDGGIIYIADGTSGKVKYYAGEGSEFGAWNSGSNVGRAEGIAADNTSFYIADASKGRLVVYSRQTRAYSRIGVEAGGSDGLLSSPADVRSYGGKFYVSDSSKGLVFTYSSNLSFEYAIGRGKGGVELASPQGIKLYQDRLYVADRTNNRVVVFTLDGYPVETLGSTPNATFSAPEDIEVGNGNLYVADSGNRMVHIFSINYTVSNDSILQAIAAANYSAAQLLALQKAAGRLGVAYANVSFATDLAEAQRYYSESLFSSASALAGKVSASASAEQIQLLSDLDLRERQLEKAALDKVAPYRQKAAGAGMAQALSDFDGADSKLLSAIGAKDYAAGAQLALSLGQQADDFASAYEAAQSSGKEAAKSQIKAELGQMLSWLQERLSAAKGSAALYMPQADFSNADRLLSDAQSGIAGGNFDAANRSLSLAAVEVSSFEASLASSSSEIGAALANISVIEFEFNASASKPMLLAANLDAERAQIAEAKKTAYSNPQLGIAMASQARDSAKAKAKEAQTFSVAASALLVMLGIIGAMGAAFYLHLRARRRKSEKAAADAAAREERRRK